MADKKQLERFLRAELRLHTQHCLLLEDQYRALLACDRPRFTASQEQCAAFMETLQAQVAARDAVLRDSDDRPATLNALLEALPDGPPSALAALRDRLKTTLERAQTLCHQNERLIDSELNYIAFTLDLFVEAGRRADVSYGGGGRLGRRKLLDRRA